MSFEQQSNLTSLLPNPDKNTTDHELSTSKSRKTSELPEISSTHPINHGSINNSDAENNNTSASLLIDPNDDNTNQFPTNTTDTTNTTNKTPILTSTKNNSTKITYNSFSDNLSLSSHPTTQQLAPSDEEEEEEEPQQDPSILITQNTKHKQSDPEALSIEKDKENMGSQPKSICAKVFDYLIICIFGGIYYMISFYATIHSQCIPGNIANDNPLNCGELINTNKTVMLDFPYINDGIMRPVPTEFPYIFGAAQWLLVILISLIFFIQPKLEKFKDIFCKMEALWREVMTAVIITQCGVGVVKTFVGRPRPNYYNYLDGHVKDAISSFPSGHASSTFCIHSLLIYHVLGAMVWAYRNDEFILSGADNVHALFMAGFWKKTRDCSSFNVAMIMVLLVIPIWISCTRLTDYYHNYSDVLAGSLWGIVVSLIVFIVFHNEIYPHNEFNNKSVMEPLMSHQSVEN